jgi:hypothetical protein
VCNVHVQPLIKFQTFGKWFQCQKSMTNPKSMSKPFLILAFFQKQLNVPKVLFWVGK